MQIAEIISKYDIICICETKIDANTTDTAIKLKDYTSFRTDRNSRGGGVICYVINTLKPKIVQTKMDLGKLEISICQISLSSTRLFIVTAY